MPLYVFFPWFVLVYVVSGIFFNFLQLLALPLFWLHRHTYHIIINFLCYCVYCQITFFAEWVGNFDLKVYGTPADVQGLVTEANICIANHYSDIDWLASYVFCERFGVLERTKCIMKNFIKFVPIMGWAWWFAEYCFIKRNWAKDERVLASTIEGYCASKVPFIMTLFCEGTRRTEEKLKASQDYARERNIVPLKYHLLPRTKGFAVMSKGLKDRIAAIYNVEWAFVNPEQATVAKQFSGGTVECHVYIKRIPISEVLCETEEAAGEFLMELYRSKDEAMEFYEKHGKFPAPMQTLPRKNRNLLTFAVCNVFIGALVAALVKFWIYNVYGLQGVLVLFFCVMVFEVLVVALSISLSMTKLGSSFGLKKGKPKKDHTS